MRKTPLHYKKLTHINFLKNLLILVKRPNKRHQNPHIGGKPGNQINNMTNIAKLLQQNITKYGM
jgi:hypothetical protein